MTPNVEIVRGRAGPWFRTMAVPFGYPSWSGTVQLVLPGAGESTVVLCNPTPLMHVIHARQARVARLRHHIDEIDNAIDKD